MFNKASVLNLDIVHHRISLYIGVTPNLIAIMTHGLKSLLVFLYAFIEV